LENDDTIGTRMTRIWADLHEFWLRFAWISSMDTPKNRANPLKIHVIPSGCLTRAQTNPKSKKKVSNA
jgi:hypothetical protein